MSQKKLIYDPVLILLFLTLFSLTTTRAQIRERSVCFLDKPVLYTLFSPDSRLLVSVSADKAIKIWNVNNGKLIKTLQESDDGEISVTFSPDGKELISGGWDNSVKVWNVESGEIKRKFVGHKRSLRSVSCHPGGSIVCSAGWDGIIKVWHTKTGINLKNLKGHNQCIRAVSFSPDGKYIASGGYDKLLKIWDLLSGKEIFSLKGHVFPIEALCFSPDGKHIITGSSDNTIKMWDVSNGNLVKTLKGHTGGIYSLDYSPDGKYIASGSNDNTIKIWNAGTGNTIETIKVCKMAVKSVSFSPDGKLLAGGSIDKSLRIWDVSSLKIKPLNKIYVKELIKIISPSEDVKFTKPVGEIAEVYKRNYTVKAEINNVALKRIRLIVNRSEHVEYDGYKKHTLKPVIKKINETTSEFAYNIYLHEGRNELQILAEKEQGSVVHISKKISLYHRDISNQIKNSDLYLCIINIPSYTDKKLNLNYSTYSSLNLIEKISSQKGKLYNSVIVKQLNSMETTTKTSIVEAFEDIFDTVSQDDVIIAIISSHIVSNNAGEYFILPSDISTKKIPGNSVNLRILEKFLSNRAMFTGIFLDASHAPAKKMKKVYDVQADSLVKYFVFNLKNIKNDYAIIICESDEQGNVFKSFTESLERDNDRDRNDAIDINEINDFINDSGRTYPIIRTRRNPFFLY